MLVRYMRWNPLPSSCTGGRGSLCGIFHRGRNTVTEGENTLGGKNGASRLLANSASTDAPRDRPAGQRRLPTS